MSLDEKRKAITRSGEILDLLTRTYGEKRRHLEAELEAIDRMIEVEDREREG